MSVRTSVQVLIEIPNDGNWSDDEKLGTLRKIAISEAIEKLRRIIGSSPSDIKIIGEPKVVNFIHPENI